MIVTVTPNPVLDRTLTVSKLVFDEVARARKVREDWGGKGFNVSRAVQALGGESVALGFLGGAVGQKLKSGLEGLGIRVRSLSIQGENRTNVVITEAETGRYIKVNEPGPEILPSEIAAFYELVDNLARTGDIFALCGSLPPGVSPDFYAQLTVRLHAAGAKVLLDTSGEALRRGIRAKPDVIKPNDREAAALLGMPVTSPAEAARAVDNLVNMGITSVALSLGAEGLLLAEGDARVWARPPVVQARNPVGAGDALVAGMLWALARNLDVPAVARWGVASGTAAAALEGVSFGIQPEVAALVQRVVFAPWPGG